MLHLSHRMVVRRLTRGRGKERILEGGKSPSLFYWGGEKVQKRDACFFFRKQNQCNVLTQKTLLLEEMSGPSSVPVWRDSLVDLKRRGPSRRKRQHSQKKRVMRTMCM